jgi:hypothetical protein
VEYNLYSWFCKDDTITYELFDSDIQIRNIKRKSSSRSTSNDDENWGYDDNSNVWVKNGL